MGFPGSSVGKESACSAGDLSSIPGWGRSPGEGNGKPLQYPCLENPMNRGAWQAAVHGVAKSWAWLRGNTSLHIHIFIHPLSHSHHFDSEETAMLSPGSLPPKWAITLPANLEPHYLGNSKPYLGVLKTDYSGSIWSSKVSDMFKMKLKLIYSLPLTTDWEALLWHGFWYWNQFSVDYSMQNMPIFYTDICSITDSINAVVFKSHFVSHPYSYPQRYLARTRVIIVCHSLEGTLLASGGER